MKRLILILCCVLLLCAVTVPVFAASGKAELVASKTQLNPGDTFTVQANIRDTDPVALCTVALEFDDGVLELTDGTCDVENTSIAEVIPSKKAGTLMLSGIRKLSGTVFTFRFRVKDTAPSGNVEIGMKAAVGLLKGEYIDATGVSLQIRGKATETPAPTQEPTAPSATTAPTQPEAAEGDEPVPTTISIHEIITEATVGLPKPTPKPTPEPQQPDDKGGDFNWGAPVGIGAAVAIGTFLVGKLLKKKKED